jgi:hypothetical protein
MTAVTLVDLVLGVLVVEVLALAWATRRETRWPSFGSLLPNLGAGFCLVLAVRAVATESPLAATGGLLAAAGLCHVADFVVRVRHRGG